MEIGKRYDVVFTTGRYEIEHENGVICIKKTPKSYRVERVDGTTTDRTGLHYGTERSCRAYNTNPKNGLLYQPRISKPSIIDTKGRADKTDDTRPLNDLLSISI